MSDKDQSYIYGRNAVSQLLESDNPSINKIFIPFSSSGTSISRIFTLAKQNKIPISKMDNRKFKDLENRIGCKHGESQGIIALKELVSLLNDFELFEYALSQNKNPIIVALDGIEDPHNLGAIARSVECSGATGILISEKGSSPITPTAVKVSTGALEMIKVSSVGNLHNSLQLAKDMGFWIVGTDMDAKRNYYDDVYDRPVILVIGSEGKGMKSNIKKLCDDVIKIPMEGKIESLNASVSTAIILFERLRQQSA